MPKGRPSRIMIELTPQERAVIGQFELLAAANRAGVIGGVIYTPAQVTAQARRLRIIRLRADGWSITDIARAVGVSRRNCYLWRWRWRSGGLPWLLRRYRRGSGAGGGR